MRIDKDKFPSLFNLDIVIARYNYSALLDSDVIAKMRAVLEESLKVQTYLARPIVSVMLESFGKLTPFRKDLTDSCRALIYTSKAGNPHVIQYVLLMQEDRIEIMGQTHFLKPNTVGFGMLFHVWLDKEPNDTIIFRSYQDIQPILDIAMHDEVMSVVLNAIVAAELFINFAEVETKIMKPNTQIWDDRMVNALYNNKTKSNITVIDSTWYTNLISSGAFNVRGHFRLQPHGPDRKKRRLQWISDFTKTGYTRKAKKPTT